MPRGRRQGSERKRSVRDPASASPPLFHSSPLPTTACQGWPRGRPPQHCVLYARAPRSAASPSNMTRRLRYALATGDTANVTLFPLPGGTGWHGDDGTRSETCRQRQRGGLDELDGLDGSPRRRRGETVLLSANATERKPTQFDTHDCRGGSRSDKVPIKGWLDDGVPFPIRNGGSCDRGVPAVPALAEPGRPVIRRGQHNSNYIRSRKRKRQLADRRPACQVRCTYPAAIVELRFLRSHYALVVLK